MCVSNFDHNSLGTWCESPRSFVPESLPSVRVRGVQQLVDNILSPVVEFGSALESKAKFGERSRLLLLSGASVFVRQTNTQRLSAFKFYRLQVLYIQKTPPLQDPTRTFFLV